MNERISLLLSDLRNRRHHQFRQSADEKAWKEFTQSLMEQQLSDVQRAKCRLTWVLSHEVPVILPHERIVFTRTMPGIPEIFTEEEWVKIKSGHYIHEMGRVCNINSNYSYTIEVGLEQRRIEVLKAIGERTALKDYKAIEFLEALLQSIVDVLTLTDRYAKLAKDTGRDDLALLLEKVPRLVQQVSMKRSSLSEFSILRCG